MESMLKLMVCIRRIARADLFVGKKNVRSQSISDNNECDLVQVEESEWADRVRQTLRDTVTLEDKRSKE